MKLRSEANGIIPDLGESPLSWLFTPLEAKAYSIQVPVRLGDNSVEILIIQVGRKVWNLTALNQICETILTSDFPP